MKIVVDTNLIFSAVLNTQSSIGDLLINGENVFQYYSCQYLRLELDSLRPKLKELSGLNDRQLDESIFQILSNISFIDEALIPYNLWHSVLPLVRDVDMDDIAFVALNEYLDAKLWTGDKKLYNGLKAKGYDNVVNVQEMVVLRNELEKN